MLAVTEAARVIERGDADACLAGGTEDRIHPVQRMRQHLSERLGKGVPFKDTGAVPGEGGAVLIVESLEHATARSATILARLTGIAGGQSPHCTRDGGVPKDDPSFASVMERAMEDAGVSAQDIDEVITSASGVNSDHAEQHAIASILGWCAGPSHHHPRQSLATAARLGALVASSAVLHQPRPSPAGLGVCHRPRRTTRRVGFGGKRMTRQVVVTGMGWITPLGQDLQTVWSALTSGQSGIKPTTRFDASTFPTRIAGQVADSFDWKQSVRDAVQHGHPGRHTTYALHAAAEAWRMAGLDQSPPNPNRSGIYLGAGEGPLDFVATCQSHMSGVRDEAYDWPTWGKTAQQAYSREFEAEQEPFAPARHLALEYDLRGPTSNC